MVRLGRSGLRRSPRLTLAQRTALMLASPRRMRRSARRNAAASVIARGLRSAMARRRISRMTPSRRYRAPMSLGYPRRRLFM